MPRSSYPSTQDDVSRQGPARPGRGALKLLVFLLLLLATIILALRAYERDPEPWEHAWMRFALPFRLAKLQTEPPDDAIAMPVEGAALRNVRDTWHASRPGGRSHEGQDIFASRGTRVLSATRGIVVRIGQNSLGGNVIFIAGPGGRNYYYAHLDGYADPLAVGDWVEPGTLLGSVGTTGNARGMPPHLHFGIYGISGAINPYPMLLAGVQEPDRIQGQSE